MFNTLWPIIIAGLMNGSFVVPSKYIRGLNNDEIWFYHSIIGLIILPWLMLSMIAPEAFNAYTTLPHTLLLVILLIGAIFGGGQICFMTAIKRIGIGASFAVNLGMGTIIGSLFVVFYKKMLLTQHGFFVILAVLLVITSLWLYYLAIKPIKDGRASSPKVYLASCLGWVFAILAGIASGLQNILFTTIFFAQIPSMKSLNPFWIWPPFLLGAAIPMAISLYHQARRSALLTHGINLRLEQRNIILIALMGICFTGSLVLYSTTMAHLNSQVQLFAWPAFMVAIILSAQFWGYLEIKQKSLPHKTNYIACSILILITAIVFLSYP